MKTCKHGIRPKKNCIECKREDARKSYQNNPERKKHKKDYQLQWARNNREKVNRTVRNCNKRLRFEVLVHYGGNPPVCSCCGENHIEFLTLDHIFGGGNKERKKFGRGSSNLFRHLKKSGFPEGYRILCMNCNHSFGHYGYCPHDNRTVREGEDIGKPIKDCKHPVSKFISSSDEEILEDLKRKCPK